jgi:rSAM/selenodomain-associated transferase 2
MGAGRNSLIWLRIGGVLVSAAALFLLFQRLKFQALLETFRTMRPGWFVAAVAANGLAFVPAAWRWHLVLRLTRLSIHPGVTWRLSLIGHLFYMVLFGAAGGDTAKAALYSKWYRMPLASVLATAPLDRFLGFVGLIFFAGVVLIWAGLAGAFGRVQEVAMDWRGGWWLLLVPLGGLGLWMAKRSAAQSAWRRFADALVGGARQLLAAPRIAAVGLACGFLVQIALNSVMASNLQAVTSAPVPWSQVVWTLPLIAIMSALPITVAGLGTREGTALLLLGIYGVSEEAAVAASLLTLSANLFWALVAALLLWLEARRQRRQRPVAKTITAVIPTLNEAASLPETLRRARAVKEITEIIVVDGGSADQTREIAGQFGCRVLVSPASRGGQMRLGASQAGGDVILLLHADTWLDSDAGQALLQSLRDVVAVGGGFWKVFQEPNLWLRGSKFRCGVRLYLGRRIAGDQGLFVRREVLAETGGVPDMPLMEEFELCSRLRKRGRLVLADATIQTSARRFARLGVARTYCRMWRVMLSYYLGKAPQDLRRIYEKD